MRKSLFTEKQIIGCEGAGVGSGNSGFVPQARHQPADAVPVAKYGGLEVSEAGRLRELEEENRQLKHALAESMLDNRALKAVLAKNVWSVE